jgi:hypothetical protein
MNHHEGTRMIGARLLVAVLVVVSCARAVHAQAGFAGRWRGETGNGRAIALELQVARQTLTGTFTLAQQTVEIKEGKVDGKTASFSVALDGRTPTIAAELAGDQLKLVVEGVSNPVMLTRVK